MKCRERHWVGRAMLRVLLVITLVLLAIAYNPARTLLSLRRVDEHPLYVMEYHGGYLFDLYLKQGVESPIFERLEAIGEAQGCTTFVAGTPEGEVIVGRSFDWRHHPALLLFTDPPRGYASVSMVDVHHLGYGDGTEGWWERVRLLFSPYITIDGMNEYGLAVSTMSVPCRPGEQEPGRTTIVGNHMLRLALDYARDVDEVLALIEEYNVYFPEACTHHVFADASGDSVVVEYIDGETIVSRVDEPWQVATNFLVAETQIEGGHSDCWRYNEAYEVLSEAGGVISEEEAMGVLEQVRQPGTVWSVVYNLTDGCIQLAMGGHFERVYQFSLEMVD